MEKEVRGVHPDKRYYDRYVTLFICFVPRTEVVIDGIKYKYTAWLDDGGLREGADLQVRLKINHAPHALKALLSQHLHLSSTHDIHSFGFEVVV